MKIILTPELFSRLEAARAAVGRHELSGFGFVKVVKQDGETLFEVYDAVLLDVGSSAFTEIPAERILPLLDRPDAPHMKLWWHAHPLGDDQPGTHNWSSTDNHTATTTPLGGVPELVKWSISMVRTPQTWVGRFDRYQDGEVTTNHIPVVFCRDQAFIDQAISYKAVYEARLDQMQKELAVLARPFGRQQLRVINWFSVHQKKTQAVKPWYEEQKVIAKQIDYETLWDSQYDDEAVIYNDALICLHEAEILSASEDAEDLDEALYLVEIAANLLNSISSINTDALRLRATTLEEKLSIR